MTVIIRDDLSDRLVHLTKPNSSMHEFQVFDQIVRTATLKGGSGMIKGGHVCICFSETPISKLGHFFANPDTTIQYKPYGIMFTKKDIYALGGRPVIYQEDGEYTNLPSDKQHLHVRFELNSFPIDHTWEREWRLKLPKMTIDPQNATLIVPNRLVAEVLREQYDKGESEKRGVDADYNPVKFPWHFMVLEDLGVTVPDGV